MLFLQTLSEAVIVCKEAFTFKYLPYLSYSWIKFVWFKKKKSDLFFKFLVLHTHLWIWKIKLNFLHFINYNEKSTIWNLVKNSVENG